MKPRRIDLYILGEILGPFVGGLLFFTFVFLMAQTLRWAEMLIVHGVSIFLIGKMVFYIVLSFIPFIVPPAFLVGVLVGFGRLSADSELIAMRANGFGVGRLTAPVMVLAALVSLFCLELNRNWAPRGDRQLYQTIIRIENTRVASAIKEGAFVSGFFDLLLFTDKFDPKTNQMRRVFLYDERDPKQPVTVVAPEGKLVQVKTGNDLGAAVVLKLQDGSIHRNDPVADSYTKIDFGEYRLFLKVEGGIGHFDEKPRMIENDELVRRIRSVDQKEHVYRELTVEYWKRICVAMTPFVFALLGVAFGIVPTRSVRAGAALVGFVAVLSYWGLLSAAMAFTERNLLPHWITLQLPNLVLGSIGAVVFKRSAG